MSNGWSIRRLYLQVESLTGNQSVRKQDVKQHVKHFNNHTWSERTASGMCDNLYQSAKLHNDAGSLFWMVKTTMLIAYQTLMATTGSTTRLEYFQWHPTVCATGNFQNKIWWCVYVCKVRFKPSVNIDYVYRTQLRINTSAGNTSCHKHL